jgi:DNA-binding beta-propeller fold protein YncE
VLVNADGTRLYVGDSATDSVGVFSLADPLNPVEIQEFALAGPKSATPGGPNQTVDFQLALDPTGRNLYVLNHQTALDGSFTDGNQIHLLSVAHDGTLSEPGNSPVLLPPSEVPPGAHPQGIVVVTPDSDHGHGHERPDVSRFFSNQPVHKSEGRQDDAGSDDRRDALDRLH